MSKDLNGANEWNADDLGPMDEIFNHLIFPCIAATGPQFCFQRSVKRSGLKLI